MLPIGRSSHPQFHQPDFLVARKTVQAGPVKVKAFSLSHSPLPTPHPTPPHRRGEYLAACLQTLHYFSR